MISKYRDELYLLNQENDAIQQAIMREDLPALQVIFDKHRIESVNQVNLKESMNDPGKYMNSNPLSFAL